MSSKSVATDRVVQNVLKIGGVFAVLGAIGVIAGIVTGDGEVNVLTRAGFFVLAVWSAAFIAALILASWKQRRNQAGQRRQRPTQ